MKILAFGYNGGNHSWAHTSQNICRSFKKLGHEVHIFSTNGIKHFPEDLKENLKGYVEVNQFAPPEKTTSLLKEYDLSISYTAPKNFQQYLYRGIKKYGIWTAEFSGRNSLPPGFCKNYKYVNKILAPSNFSKNIFIENNVPEEYLEVIPHGYSSSFINRTESINIKTDRKFKFLINYGQLHKRKNISSVLEAWGRAFTDKDDVVLVAKLAIKPATNPFEITWSTVFETFKKKYKNHAPIIIIQDFIPDISDIYRSCNALISFGSEGFNLPVLECVASKKIPVCLDKGPHLDFTNENNAVYVKSTEVRAPVDYQYWQPSPYAKMFQPDINDAAEKLQYVFKNEVSLIQKFNNEQNRIRQEYSWDNIVQKIEELSQK